MLYVHNDADGDIPAVFETSVQHLRVRIRAADISLHIDDIYRPFLACRELGPFLLVYT